jgi:hypothetical protein
MAAIAKRPSRSMKLMELPNPRLRLESLASMISQNNLKKASSWRIALPLTRVKAAALKPMIWLYISYCCAKQQSNFLLFYEQNFASCSAPVVLPADDRLLSG